MFLWFPDDFPTIFIGKKRNRGHLTSDIGHSPQPGGPPTEGPADSDPRGSGSKTLWSQGETKQGSPIMTNYMDLCGYSFTNMQHKNSLKMTNKCVKNWSYDFAMISRNTKKRPIFLKQMPTSFFPRHLTRAHQRAVTSCIWHVQNPPNRKHAGLPGKS